MANIGDTFPYTVPLVGSPGPTYATTINNILGEMITRVSTKVPLSSVNFSTDLNLNGQAITNAAYVTLVNTPATPGSSPVNRVTAFGGDLWYVSPSGPVQLTTGAALNSAAIGGITGAYGGANPAQFRYDNVATRYDAYANFGTSTWAYIRQLGVDIAAGATSTVYARLLFAGVVNRTYTLPLAPASANDRPLFMDTTGQITVGHGNKTISLSLVNTALASVGNLAQGTLAGPPGAITGVAVISNATVAATNAPAASQGIPGLVAGQRITSILIEGVKVNTSTTTWALRRFRPSVSTTSTVAVGTVSTSTNGYQLITIGPLTETVTGDAYYTLDLTNFGPNAANEYWIGARVVVDQPS